MSVLPVQHREVSPASSGIVKPLQLAGNPARFRFRRFQFHDANLFAFGPVRLKELLRKFGTDLIHADCLRRHAKNVGRRSVIVRQRDCGTASNPAPLSSR